VKDAGIQRALAVRIGAAAGASARAGGAGGAGGGGCSTAQPAARLPTIAATMWLVLLEALVALALLVFIVWWTMFSGRKKGERRDPD
jgi:hypothetical protein